MTSDHDYLLGQINARLDNLVKGQEELFKRLNEFAENGSSLCKRNAKDIEELKSQPERLVAVFCSIVAAIAAVVAWIKAS